MSSTSLFDTLWQTWERRSKETGVVGAANVANAQSPYKRYRYSLTNKIKSCVAWYDRFFWGLVLLVGSCMTLYDITGVINAYRDYAVTTTISLEKRSAVQERVLVPILIDNVFL